MREYGPVRKGFTGDPGDPSSVDAAAPYIGSARLLLGQMKNQMRLGGLDHLTRTVNLPDGTAIQVMSSHGQDTIRINVAGTVSQPESEENFATETSEVSEVELQPIPVPLPQLTAFYVIPGTTVPPLLLATLPWNINGKLYTTYPAGLLIPSGSTVIMSNRVDGSGNWGVTSTLFGVVALDKFGAPLAPNLQPTNWSSTDAGAASLTADQLKAAAPDAGPPYYFTAQFQTKTNTKFLQTYKGTTKEGTPNSVKAVIDIRIPGMIYTFIDFPPSQTVSGGLSIFPDYFLPFTVAPFMTSETGDGETWFTHGSDSMGSFPQITTVDQTWNTTSPGPLSTGEFTSIDDVLARAPNIHPNLGVMLEINNAAWYSATGFPPVTLHVTTLICTVDSANQPGDGINDIPYAVVDANNTTVSIPTIKQCTVSGIADNAPYSQSFPSVSIPHVARITHSSGVDSYTDQPCGMGPGHVVMNRRSLPVT